MRAKEAIAQLDLAPDLDPARACRSWQRRLTRNSRTLDDELDFVQQSILLAPRVHFDARSGKPPGLDLAVTVGGDDFHAAPSERERGRLAGACEADDEDAARQLHGAAQRRKKV
jgi:hypothetical protein